MPSKVTVTGRIVWASGASPLDLTDVLDTATGQPRLKDGVKMQERGFGLAVPKLVNGQPNPEFALWWQSANVEAAKVCNGVAPAFPNARVFSYKLTDGDGRAAADLKRNLPERDYPEYYKGCWVISIKSQLPNAPTVFDINDNSVIDPNNIRGANKLKVGDFVRVGLSIEGHLGQSPGLYQNPDGIQFVGFGPAIVRGPDAATMFGAPGSVALPAGASATPVGPTGAPAAPGLPAPAPAPQPVAPAPGLPGQPGNAFAPVAAPQPVPLAAPAPALAPAPAIASPGSLAPAPAPLAAPLNGFAAGQPQLPGMPAPAPVAPRITVTRYDAATGRPIGVDPTTGQEVWAD